MASTTFINMTTKGITLDIRREEDAVGARIVRSTFLGEKIAINTDSDIICALSAMMEEFGIGRFWWTNSTVEPELTLKLNGKTVKVYDPNSVAYCWPQESDARYCVQVGEEMPAIRFIFCEDEADLIRCLLKLCSK